MSETKKIIEEFLREKNLPFTFDDTLNQYRTTVTIHDNLLNKDFTYPAAISLVRDWVVTEAAIVDLKTIPNDIQLEKIYDGMLRANFAIPEVNYALYQSMIISLAWSKASALNKENFASEFTGVIEGIDKFPQVAVYAKKASFVPPKEFTPMYQ